MNWIDLVILVLLGFFIVKGFFRGILIESFTLIGLVFGYFISLNMMGPVSKEISHIVSLPPLILSILGFLSVFFIVFIIFRLFAWFIRRLIKKTPIIWLDRLGGLLFGFCKGILIISLATLLLSISPISKKLQNETEKSMLLSPVRWCAPMIFNGLTWTLPKVQSFSEALTENVIIQTSKRGDPNLAKRLKLLKEELNDFIRKRENHAKRD